MIEPVLHLLKIHRKVIFGNTAVIVQNMLGVAPKSFNAVDMILAAIRKRLAVVQAMMLLPALQGVAATERIRVIHRSLSGMFSNMAHQLVGRHLFHDFGVDSPVALQNPENNAFSGSTPATLPLAPATEVGFVNLNFSFEFACFKLGHMIDRLTQVLVDAGNCLIIQAKVGCHTIGGLLLVKTGEDGNLSPKTRKVYLVVFV